MYFLDAPLSDATIAQDQRDHVIDGFLTGTADETEIRRFYQFLSEWEQQHLDALQSLSETIRGDFWEKGGFSPF